MSEECPTSARRITKKEEWVVLKGTNVTDDIAVNPSLVEDKLAAVMTPGPDEAKPYSNILILAMVQPMVDKMVSAKFEYVNFEFFLCQTIDNMESSPIYLLKDTEVLSETEEGLQIVAHVVKTETGRLTDTSSKYGERIKRLAWAV